MEVLLSVEAVTSGMNLKALRHLYATTEAQVHGPLSSMVLSKIPQEICLVISCETGDGNWKLDNLMKILLGELRAREIAAASDIASVKG